MRRGSVWHLLESVARRTLPGLYCTPVDDRHVAPAPHLLGFRHGTKMLLKKKKKEKKMQRFDRNG